MEEKRHEASKCPVALGKGVTALGLSPRSEGPEDMGRPIEADSQSVEGLVDMSFGVLLPS